MFSFKDGKLMIGFRLPPWKWLVARIIGGRSGWVDAGNSVSRGWQSKRGIVAASIEVNPSEDQHTKERV